RFADKSRHQLFLEPESRETDFMYLQGFSTSMPEDIQEQMVHSLPGLEQAVILKYAYAIEYDALVPTQFLPSLELKKWPGLFGAGQIIGTSGYEEAAGLGLMAGINAVRKIKNLAPFILRRDKAYIGVMIDDLVTKGTLEPYRLLSSRAEYRLLLRHDNADLRLREMGYELGLINEERYGRFLKKNEDLRTIFQIINNTTIRNHKAINEYLVNLGSQALNGGINAAELLRRPEIDLRSLLQFVSIPPEIDLSDTLIEQLEVMIKYEGYIQKQDKQAQKIIKQESIMIPPTLDYAMLDGLAIEARQKLAKIQPLTIGQASRISGVNPSDIAMLVLYLKRNSINGSTSI
ncbi:MAG TPA: tRNA uridine-5-carboxymethylaminomethyl(34) synthesis enzyme MnmG, partial [Firmicutes bacterium]|nr:tRNA uridine-5-carboxymethylaminomethyl(34) synthesis enzyme MnmG [Bacillota bacterium]